MTEPATGATVSAAQSLFTLLKGLAIVIALGLLVHVTRMVLNADGNVGPPDAFAYHDAALELRAGQDIYAANKALQAHALARGVPTDEQIAAVAGKPFIYIYPPAFASLYAPLTLLDEETGFLVWWLLHFGMLAWLAAALFKLCRIQGLNDRMTLGLILMVGLYGALSAEFRWGQVNLLVFCLVATGLWLVEDGRHLFGGLILALAAHVKVLPAALLVLLLLQRQNRAALWMAAGGLLLMLLPVPWLFAHRGGGAFASAIEMHLDYVRTVVLPALGSGRTSGIPQFYTSNNSLHALLHRLFGEGTVLYPTRNRLDTSGPLLFALPQGVISALGWTGAIGLFSSSLWFGFKARAERLGRVASAGLVLIALQFANVLFWEHHVVSLILPLAAMMATTNGSRRALWVTLPITLTLSLPAAINDALVLADSDPMTNVVLLARLWGLPTLAILVVCIATVMTFGRKTMGIEPARPAGALT